MCAWAKTVTGALAFRPMPKVVVVGVGRSCGHPHRHTARIHSDGAERDRVGEGDPDRQPRGHCLTGRTGADTKGCLTSLCTLRVTTGCNRTGRPCGLQGWLFQRDDGRTPGAPGVLRGHGWSPLQAWLACRGSRGELPEPDQSQTQPSARLPRAGGRPAVHQRATLSRARSSEWRQRSPP